MEADIRAEHGNRTKCIISDKTKYSLDDILYALSRLSLPEDVSSDTDFMS